MTEAVPMTVVRADGPTCRAEFEVSDWVCPLCSGREGSYIVDDAGYEVWKHCDCRSQRRRQQLFNAAGIGKRYADATLDSFQARTVEQEQALRVAQDYILMYPKVGGGLLFWGAVGTGKTHLAVGMFRELTLRKGVGCRFIDYGQLLADLKRSFSQQTGDSALMLPLINVEVLVIDELGKGRGTPWEEGVLDDVISRRYNAQKVTLFTTNFEPTDSDSPAGESVNPAYQSRQSQSMRAGATPSLRERVGDRIYSRLCEMCEFVSVSGSDYRQTSQGLSRRGVR